MLSYVRDAQRRMNEPGLHVNVFEGPSFKESDKGLVAVLYNRFPHQQANGAGIRSRNMLSISEIEKYKILSFEMWEM